MKHIVKIVFYSVIPLLIITLFLSEMAYTAPVTLEQAKYHMTILKDGKCEILYQLTFTELESRDRIRTIGQFIEPMSFIQTYGTHRGKRFKVTMQSKGNAFYSAVFNITTKKNEKYTINLRYRIDKPVLDKTTYNNKDYAIFWWSPIQWSLPIKKQIARIIIKTLQCLNILSPPFFVH